MAREGAIVVGCTGHLAPDGDAEIAFISYCWRVDELRYSMPNDLLWRTMTRVGKRPAEIDAKAQQSRRASPSAARRSALCNRMVIGLIRPASHLNCRLPDDTKLLDATSDAHPELPLKWKRENFIAGCVMQSCDSGGRAFGGTKSRCECETRANFAQTSQKQREQLFGNCAGKQISDAAIPRAMPANLACETRAVHQMGK